MLIAVAVSCGHPLGNLAKILLESSWQRGLYLLNLTKKTPAGAFSLVVGLAGFEPAIPPTPWVCLKPLGHSPLFFSGSFLFWQCGFLLDGRLCFNRFFRHSFVFGGRFSIANLFDLSHGLDAFGTGLDSLTIVKTNPLKIGVFSFLAGWVILSTKLDAGNRHH